MTPPAFTHTTRVPLPANLPPQLMLSALHTYEPLITANPYMKEYERRPVVLEEIVNDPFFRDDGFKLQAYEVLDKVPVFAGLTTAVRIPCVFQSFDQGVRCRADAQGGVTVRSSYEVRRRGEVPLAPNEMAEGVEIGRDSNGRQVSGEWEFVEVANIDCGILVKPFVKKGFSHAHTEILNRTVDNISRRSEGQGARYA